MRRMPLVLVALIVPVVAAAAVVVTLAVTDDNSSVAAAGGNTIQIKDFDFSPKPLEVAAGSTVTIVNRDDTTHTVTSEKDGAFDTGEVSGGTKATIKVGDPGTYKFFCAIHDYMHGTIKVT